MGSEQPGVSEETTADLGSPLEAAHGAVRAIPQGGRLVRGRCWPTRYRLAGVRRKPLDAEPREAPIGKGSERPAATENLRGDGAMATILLVEDHPATRELLVEYLEAEGHTVVEAGTGVEALTIAAAAAPDLVLLDLRLPDARGFDLAQRLRAEARMANVPILALTAYPGDHVAEALAASGCTGYLTKPITRDILLEALRHYLPER